jgi:hypothetical protein
MDGAIQAVMRRSLISGTVAGLGVMATAAAAGRRETGSWAAPFNGTSHILWGDRQASSVQHPTVRHTLPGIVLTHASAVFWAAFYEQFFGSKQWSGKQAMPLWKPLLGGAAIASLAYVNDYYLMPKRLTPGYELHVSGKSLATIFGALALGLAACDLFASLRQSRRAA